MNKNSAKDPLGHIKLSVSNFQASNQFYSKIFEKLGFKKISDKKESVAWATPEGFGIWISQAKTLEPKYKFSSPGLHHLCVKAYSEKKVDEVFNLMKDECDILESPKKYPEYTEKYYATVLLDPDGIKLEVSYY